ncbi:disulfide bond formation protein B [Aquabacter spiritensis]|uniref:Thiol:disulfide interchange protein DsbB n=1 Tax=Aquabacter spiritensis TaxID=933073 RepID=A0A4R3LUQ0_9HYPH|nr:disulfide bond formation protein B [Aquabacter spiritensis]TCT04282.1 thiol:disulfide interchange protein DsbB [Aquabacter spiritensis]
MTPALSRTLNALGLLAVSTVLIAAFFDQLVFGDLPCPLCLLQRAGFVVCGFGLALNVKFGPRPSHYAMLILGAVAGGVMATRQTLLHIVPGEGAYGDAFFGLHFYAWAATLFAVIVVGGAVMLLFDRQFETPPQVPARLSALALASLGLALLMAFANGASTVLECGGGLCPDNPTSYQLLDAWRGGTGPAR